MKMKRLISGLLVSVMAVSLAGCVGGETSTETSETGEGGIVTLKAHFIGSPQADVDKVEEALNEYTRENLGVELDMVFTDFGDYDQKTQLIVNSGEDYDIMFTSAWANDYLTNARKGAFLDLTPYLESEEYKALYDEIDPAFWEGAKVDGAIYAVPTQKEIAIMPMYMFNKDIVEKSGFDYTKVEKLSDVEPYLEYVKANNPEVTPFMIFADRAYRGPYDYVLGFDYPILVDEEGKVQYMYDVPDIKEHVLTMRDFFEKGYINQDAATKSGTMKRGEVFGLSYGDGQPFAEVIWSIDSGFDIVTADMQQPIVTTSTTRGAMLAINKNSKNKEAALDLMQAINTDSELHNILNYGIEGVHYEKVSDNQIKRTEQGQSSYLVPTFGLGNLFNTYTIEGEPENKWEVFKQENDAAIRSEFLGFDIDTSNIKNELAAMNNLRIQYEPLIQSGAVDVEVKMEEFKTKLDEVGLQKVIDEVQKQVDEFKNKSN